MAKKGEVKNRVGETRVNKFGYKMTITKYSKSNDIIVKFNDTGYIINSTYTNFKTLNIRHPYDRTVYGVGFIGEGIYDTTIDHIISPQYNTWHSMLQRCYDPKFRVKRPTYAGCSVCEEWHNLQNFGKWYDENYYQVEEQEMHLDKDILVKGNKVYSPETCVFVPHNINTLFIKRDADRGEFPIGVYYKKQNRKYVAQCSNGKDGKDGTQQYLGLFNTPQDAFWIYKTYKENIIKKIAHEYKDNVPIKLYNALLKYEVEYDD